jgi:hypothetical protein
MPQRPMSGCSTCPDVSGRSRACGGQPHAVALDNQPTLCDCISTGRLENRHLPVTDVRRLYKIVQCQFVANTATFVIHDHIQQFSSYWLCCVCFSASFVSPLMNIFSHQQRLMVAGETDQSFQLFDRGTVNDGSEWRTGAASQSRYAASFSSFGERCGVYWSFRLFVTYLARLRHLTLRQ